MAGRYGHIRSEQTYAVWIPVSTENLGFGSLGQLGINPDPSKNRILYRYETISKSNPESSSEEGESDDNTNDNNNVKNENENDIVENIDKTEEDTMEGMISLGPENAMSLGQNGKPISNFYTQCREKNGILVKT